VVEFGPVASVLETPQHPYTMALLAANPHIAEGEQIPRRLPTIPGTVPNPGEWPVGCRFAARCRFVQPACQAAVDLEPAGEGTAVRCVRSVELKESGMTWVTELADPVDADGVPR
jgi:peptide/nickel transport system permease protein